MLDMLDHMLDHMLESFNGKETEEREMLAIHYLSSSEIHIGLVK